MNFGNFKDAFELIKIVVGAGAMLNGILKIYKLNRGESKNNKTNIRRVSDLSRSKGGGARGADVDRKSGKK
jgi:hypothetical protein